LNFGSGRAKTALAVAVELGTKYQVMRWFVLGRQVISLDEFQSCLQERRISLGHIHHGVFSSLHRALAIVIRRSRHRSDVRVFYLAKSAQK
jgi:hypothetical protein